MRFAYAAAPFVTIALAALPMRAQAPRPEGPRLAMTSTGKGTPVVVVTGMLGSAFAWRKVVPSLVADDFRVTVVDPLGFGASPRPDDGDYSASAQATRVGEEIAHLGSGPVILACQALSGPICLRIANQRPDLVRGIVSINGGASEHAGTGQIRFALKFARIVLFFAGRSFALHKLKDGLIEASGDASWVTDETVNAYVAPFGSDPREIVKTLQRIVEADEPTQMRPDLAQIRAPVLLLYGPVIRNPRNPTIPSEERTTMRAQLPRFEEEVVPGAGQFIQEEQPARVVAAIEKMRALTEVAEVGKSRTQTR